MDCIILHCRGCTQEDVEATGSEFGLKDECVYFEPGQFYFRRYGLNEYEAEYEPAEKAALEARLGGRPSASFVVAARHGESAKAAIRFLAALLSRLPTAIVDDDLGGLWEFEGIQSLLKKDPDAGIFSLGETNG